MQYIIHTLAHIMYDHEMPCEYIMSQYLLQFIYKLKNIVLIGKS